MCKAVLCIPPSLLTPVRPPGPKFVSGWRHGALTLDLGSWGKMCRWRSLGALHRGAALRGQSSRRKARDTQGSPGVSPGPSLPVTLAVVL